MRFKDSDIRPNQRLTMEQTIRQLNGSVSDARWRGLDGVVQIDKLDALDIQTGHATKPRRPIVRKES